MTMTASASAKEEGMSVSFGLFEGEVGLEVLLVFEGVSEGVGEGVREVDVDTRREDSQECWGTWRRGH
jgi:hypothetical protein